MEVLQSRVLLRPSDYERSVAFYEDQIGLVRYRDWGEPPHRGVVFFLGGGYLELTERSDGPDAVDPPAGARSGVRLWLQVESAAAACAELADRDVTVEAWPRAQPWGLIEGRVHDPDGLPLLIVETPTSHPLRRRDGSG